MAALLGILVSSFIVAFSGAMMPGPLLTVAIGESTKQGFLAGPLLMLGHAILEVFLVIALIAGLGPLLNRDSVFGVIAFAGAFILLWMALGMFRSLPTLTLDVNSGGTGSNHLVFSGAALSLANPYWTIWWATIGLGYILHSQTFGLPGILAFFSGHLLADFAWYSAVTYSVSKGRTLFSEKIYRGLIGTCACMLVVFAGYFGYSGWDRIFT
jgi:threonine/homoserine/homoserine lactone efflux protein